MHGEFRRSFAMAFEMTPIEIGYHQVAGRKSALIHAGGRGQDAAVAQANREIPVTGHNVTPLIQPPARNAKVLPMLQFGFACARLKGVGGHEHSWSARIIIGTKPGHKLFRSGAPKNCALVSDG
jgi:hypothetical protein